MPSTTLQQLRDAQPRAAQQPFARVAPVVRAALLLGAGGGFALATVLTTAVAVGRAGGPWWLATVQAHGHLQLFGWAGLIVVGVALHFLPRLSGQPLARSGLVPIALGALVAGFILRGISQPLVAGNGAGIWRVALALSGVLELGGYGLIATVLVATHRHPTPSPLPTRHPRPAILPLVAGAGASLALATLVNTVNVFQAARSPLGLVAPAGDDLNTLIGEFGVLVPMALAMSAQTLPMYAGLAAFPLRRLRWLAGTYLAGLALAAVGTAGESIPATWPGAALGGGLALLGGALVGFIGSFVALLRARGTLPATVAAIAPDPAAAGRAYRQHVAQERAAFGPFVPLVASAYLWALLGGVLALVDGVALARGATPPVVLDAIRHSLAVGFIALLICGIAARMVPGFSGRQIRSPRLVWATFWLGNLAAALRVGAVLLATPLASSGDGGTWADGLLFGLAGPAGLALAVVLVVNLWPALAARS